MPGRVLIVNHTHWDREWYRTFEAFRSRLIDTVDRVLDLVEADPAFRFLLDGQAILLEDYLLLRPHRRAEIVRAVRDGRIAIGPWYVQPDGFIPSGESAVRNLLEGRRVSHSFGPHTSVGYVPDTFGHCSQLPAILRGFGLTSFVFRRGLGDEYDTLPSEFRWEASDGTPILALHMPLGYGAAGFLAADDGVAVKELTGLVELLRSRSTGDVVLVMHGNDHTFPARDVTPLGALLADATGLEVQQGLLDEYADSYLPSLDNLPVYRGELRGSRADFLLHGVLSTHVEVKVANARCEGALELGAEPLAAILGAFGGPDESPALRAAWRALLPNHAHDSICGCSSDPVMEQVLARFEPGAELAAQTALRCAERLAGATEQRGAVWEDGLDIAVFNPNPYPANGLASYTFDAYPPYRAWRESPDSFRQVGVAEPIAQAIAAPGFVVVSDTDDESPGRRVERPNIAGRFTLDPASPDMSVEFVARDMPALGWRRFRIEADDARPDELDDGRDISDGPLTVSVADNGTLTVNEWSGLLGVEDVGDRGDTYDVSPVGAPITGAHLEHVVRTRSCDGVQRLTATLSIAVPASLDPKDRSRRIGESQLGFTYEARLVPGTGRVDISVTLDNTARDHRLRLRFPTGLSGERSIAGSPFDIVDRDARPPVREHWHQPPPSTFPIHGGVTVAGARFAVLTEGLNEGEVNENGDILVALVRSVGWVTRADLDTRSGVTGPTVEAPGAQCEGRIEARLAIVPQSDPARILHASREWRSDFIAVPAHARPLAPPRTDLLRVEPAPVTLSACKPADDGDGVIVRLLNPDRETLGAIVRPGWPATTAVPCRLDETPLGEPFAISSGVLPVEVPARSFITLRLR